jgi:cytochrome P450
MTIEAFALEPTPERPANGPPRRVRQLPSPKGLPLLGNLFQLDPRRLHLVLEGWAREHGSLYAFWAGPKPTVVISDPLVSDQILRARPDDYRRIGTIETVFTELKMPGVFTAEGPAWRTQRRLLLQALSGRRISSFYPNLNRVLQRLQARWKKAAASGATLDVLDEFKRLTVDVTTLLAFGHDANTVEHDEDALREQLQVLFPTINRRLTAAVPYWRLFRLPADRRADRCIRELRARLEELIAATRLRLETQSEQPQAPTNLLEALLLETDEQGRPMSDELILGNALQVLLAGEDTTAATLAWAVHLMCEQPEAVARLREELDRVLGAHAFPTDPEMAGRLSQIDTIVHETMRLRSVTPLMLLQSNKDVVVNGVAIPGGTWIILLMRYPALEAAHFERPLDFLPRRWEGGSGQASDAADGSERACCPFGGGARICPGRTLAMLEMRAALATLYSSFDVERVGSADQVGERFAFIVEPVSLQVKLRPRARRI